MYINRINNPPLLNIEKEASSEVVPKGSIS